MSEVRTNKKYDAILEASKDLFWKHGFRRVTVEEICIVSGTSKMTFYRYFPNKSEVAKTVINKVFDDGITELRKIFRDETAPAEKLRKIIQMKYDGTYSISKEFMDDFYRNPEIGLSVHVDEKVKSTMMEYISLFREGQEKGWIRKEMNLEFMFRFFQSMTIFLFDNKMLSLFNTPQDLIMEITNLFIYGITPIKK